MMLEKKCGIISIIGRTNVGKSTLFNSLLKQSLSIITKKTNTTQQCISGIQTIKNKQLILIDTPGPILHNKHNYANKTNKYIESSILQTDIILFLLEIKKIKKEEIYLFNLLKNINKPIIILINKIDKIDNKNLLLPYIMDVKDKIHYSNIIPISAKCNDQNKEILNCIDKLIPYREHIFDKNKKHTITEIFFLKEIIRKYLLINLNNEIPYTLNIKIEKYKKLKTVYIIKALIIVKKENHKAIIIGINGKKIKIISIQIKNELENIYKKKIYINLIINNI